MSRRRTILLSLLGVAILAVLGISWYLAPIAPIATGYAAKIVCSAHLVSDRSVDDALGDLPPNPLVPLLRTRAEADSVTVTLVGLWGTTAHHTPGLGCTLADERPGFTAPAALPARDPALPWPDGEGPALLEAGDGAIDGVDRDALDAAIATAFTEDDPDGRLRNTRAVVVVHDGRLLAERYGDGFDADTPLLGWSMGKSIANAIVGRLVHQGVLDVEAAALRPEWSGDDRGLITVAQLLAMTDGLDFAEIYEPGTDATQMLFRPGSVAGFAAARDLAAPPGTRWSYSSGTTNLLCAVAHEASGFGPELAHQLVFTPLGLTSAVLEPDATGELVCSSFPYLTARDWARFGQWYLQDGVWDGERLLPEGWVAASTTPVGEVDDDPYGWQWWLNEGPDGQLRMPSVPADAYWASGNEGQQVVVIPSEELVVVRLGFSGSFSGVDWGLEPLLAGVIEATG